MLLRYQFSNFQCFRSQQEFSLIASLGADPAEDLLPMTPLKGTALRAAAIYGANASGKTTVLRAMHFMARAVENSHRRWKPDRPIPVRPFRSGEDGPSAPSEFAAEFILGGVRHQYAFSLDGAGVVAESLVVFPNGKKQAWYKRERGKPIAFGRSLAGDNKTIEGLTRANSLFLSAAAQNNHEALSRVYNWFSSCLSFVSGDRTSLGLSARQSLADEERRSEVVELLRVADLGISDVRVEAPELSESARRTIQDVARLLDSLLETDEHLLPVLSEMPPSIQLLHKMGGSLVPFDLSEESNGTIAYLALLGPISKVLKDGGVILVDELDSSVHPVVVAHILRLFKGSKTNPRGAQLIFNTHDTSLLSRGLLRRDEVWFTEKSREGASQLYPLTDFKPRKEENLGSGYLQGRYGAIPFIASETEAEEGTDGEEVR